MTIRKRGSKPMRIAKPLDWAETQIDAECRGALVPLRCQWYCIRTSWTPRVVSFR